MQQYYNVMGENALLQQQTKKNNNNITSNNAEYPEDAMDASNEMNFVQFPMYGRIVHWKSMVRRFDCS